MSHHISQRSRTAGTYRRLAKLMADLGWTVVRVRDLTRGGYKVTDRRSKLDQQDVRARQPRSVLRNWHQARDAASRQPWVVSRILVFPSLLMAISTRLAFE
jgi:dienelactone hydrolase